MLQRRHVAYSVAIALLAFAAAACSGAGDEPESGQSAAAQQAIAAGFEISSSEFSDVRPRKRIPPRSTCHGEDLSPPLTWSGAPAGTQSLALVGEDVDHDTGVWVHWVLYNIPAGVTELVEGIPTSTDTLPDGTIQGTNDFRNLGYNGPCPKLEQWHYSYLPDTSLPHKYYFRLYALDAKLGLAPGATKDELESAMEGHILSQTETLGKNSPPVILSTKGGRGFLETSAKEGDAAQQSGAETSTGETIYNSLGERVTPTPTGR